MTATSSGRQAQDSGIAELDSKLCDANNSPNSEPNVADEDDFFALHPLLLLSDSALPLGSFAFSSGLESYLAHHRLQSSQSRSSFPAFLSLSLSALASTALPYALAAYRHPELLLDLDNDFDASTPCTVARRASVSQGRALLSVWERSFKSFYIGAASDGSGDANSAHETALAALSSFQSLLRTSSSAADSPYPSETPNVHFPPLWGILTYLLHIPIHASAYLFLFSHARTVVSAAVRASVLGPYQAQAVLAGTDLQERIRQLLRCEWGTNVEEAGQTVPVMDLWVGRHELLYSRIFNS